jgi:galactose mutarotase-like enzyme
MVTLENDDIKAEISNKGAELIQIHNKKTNKDYLWHGDPAYWQRHAPLLFPIVGKLNNGTYTWKSAIYSLPQHGFLRDMDFIISAQSSGNVTFKAESSAQTKQYYPFDWIFICSYKLIGNTLETKVKVINPSIEDDLLFSVGFHPAFSCPIENHLSFGDYYLSFNNDASADRWILEDGLLNNEVKQGITAYSIRLQNDTFSKDAMVFKHLGSDEITLKSTHSDHGVTLYCKDFPFMGIWSKPGAQFVCIEPWHGIADHSSHSGHLSDKEGIITLRPTADFTCSFAIKVY